MKTFILYQGNKSRYLKYILPEIQLNQDSTYIEPFLGSGAVFLKLKPKNYVLNDINKDVINIWNNVKYNSDELIEEIKEFEDFKYLNRKEKKEYLKKEIPMIENLEYDIKRAAKYLSMKYFSYMGNIFVKNKFNYAGLSLNNESYCFKEGYHQNILKVSEFLRIKDNIYNSDYKEILSKAKKGDFVFLDPPYVENINYQFSYNKNEKFDMIEFKEEVIKLKYRGVKFIITYAETDFIKDLFKDFKMKSYQVYRRASNTYKYEILILNN